MDQTSGESGQGSQDVAPPLADAPYGVVPAGPGAKDGAGSAKPLTPAAGQRPYDANSNGESRDNDSQVDAAQSAAQSNGAATQSGVVEVPKDIIPKNLQEVLAPVSGLENRIEAIAKAVERVREREGELAKQIPNVEKIISEANDSRQRLEPRLEDLRSQIARLGPAPDGKDVPPESAEIAAERARLNALSAEVDGAIKKTQLLQVRGRQLISQIQGYRQQLFAQDILRHTGSPLGLANWLAVGEQFPGAITQIEAITSAWVSAARAQWPWVLGLFVFVALGYGGLQRVCMRRVQKAYLLREDREPPSVARKAYVAGWYGLLAAAPALAAVGLLYVGLRQLDLLFLQAGQFALAGLKAFLVYTVTSKLARAYLAPYRPEWRLVQIQDALAARLFAVVRGLAAVFAVDMLAGETIRYLFLPPAVAVVTMFVSTIAVAGLLIWLLRAPVSKETGVEPGGILPWLRAEHLKAPAAIVLVAILASALAGYVPLGHFIWRQVLTTGAALALLGIAFIAIRALATGTVSAAAAVLSDHDTAVASSDGERPAAGFNLGAYQLTAWGLYGLLLLAAIPILLLSVGFTSTEIFSLAYRGAFGFEVGGFQVSLFRIAIAAALFAGVLFATRLVQRGLSESVLHPRRTAQGLANSIRTGVGYLGFFIAALLGLSYVGLDITNLAIVAGALSVGIGFGLQSIVNNFVSGLILLVERPVKVGDWIQVGDRQGYVRRISVRSTELETFERASVIIPNSELITGSVTNLTHRNAMGRLTIPVGVSYEADPERVQTLLLEVAEACPLVARHPAPFVVFEGFGDSALDFSLRVYLADINKGLSTQTQVRTQIWKAFRQAGIEIPFPQRDLHLRDLDGLRNAIAKAVEERARQSSASGFAGAMDESAAAAAGATGVSPPDPTKGGADTKN